MTALQPGGCWRASTPTTQRTSWSHRAHTKHSAHAHNTLPVFPSPHAFTHSRPPAPQTSSTPKLVPFVHVHQHIAPLQAVTPASSTALRGCGGGSHPSRLCPWPTPTCAPPPTCRRVWRPTRRRPRWCAWPRSKAAWEMPLLWCLTCPGSRFILVSSFVSFCHPLSCTMARNQAGMINNLRLRLEAGAQAEAPVAEIAQQILLQTQCAAGCACVEGATRLRCRKKLYRHSADRAVEILHARYAHNRGLGARYANKLRWLWLIKYPWGFWDGTLGRLALLWRYAVF